jgi:hypothetical protein
MSTAVENHVVLRCPGARSVKSTGGLHMDTIAVVSTAARLPATRHAVHPRSRIVAAVRNAGPSIQMVRYARNDRVSCSNQSVE